MTGQGTIVIVWVSNIKGGIRETAVQGERRGGVLKRYCRAVSNGIYKPVEQEEKRNQNCYQFGFFFRCHYQKFIAKILSLFSSRYFVVSGVTFKVSI